MLTVELMHEINILSQFDLNAMQQGIKIHGEAEDKLRAASERLYNKGLIDQVDGGYLTHRGIEAAKHAQVLLDALQHAEPEPASSAA
ncbi:MAG: TIGR02647 family protein [Pseudomonadales bacterium]|nr:TIGR02647 family protein [Pseudomonadales bacterium]